MPSLADVDAMATALPDVVETTSYGNRAWAVGAGRKPSVFVWERPFSTADLRRFGDDPVPTGVIIGARVDDLAEKEAILQEGAAGIFTIPHFDGYPAVLIQLDVVDPERLRTAIEDAWLSRAPRSTADAYLADRDGG